MCDNRVMMFIDKLFVCNFVFYVMLFELMLKKFTVISFATTVGSYRSCDAITKQSATVRKDCAIAKIGLRV